MSDSGQDIPQGRPIPGACEYCGSTHQVTAAANAFDATWVNLCSKCFNIFYRETGMLRPGGAHRLPLHKYPIRRDKAQLKSGKENWDRRRHNPMDDRLRRLRRTDEPLDVEGQARLLQERMRAGEITAHQVKIIAAIDPAAHLLYPESQYWDYREIMLQSLRKQQEFGNETGWVTNLPSNSLFLLLLDAGIADTNAVSLRLKVYSWALNCIEYLLNAIPPTDPTLRNALELSKFNLGLLHNPQIAYQIATNQTPGISAVRQDDALIENLWELAAGQWPIRSGSGRPAGVWIRYYCAQALAWSCFDFLSIPFDAYLFTTTPVNNFLHKVQIQSQISASHLQRSIVSCLGAAELFSVTRATANAVRENAPANQVPDYFGWFGDYIEYQRSTLVKYILGDLP